MDALKNHTKLQNGRCTIECVIGQGGFGITYKASMIENIVKKYGSVETTIPVVIKEFFLKNGCIRKEDGKEVAAHPEKRENFENFKKRLLEREPALISQLKHPYIVNVFDTFEENNTTYMVMEYIQGTDLQKMLEKEHKLPVEVALKYAGQIVEGLQAAHAKGIIHLDIKPSNLLITEEGAVKIIDFGIAKQYAAEIREKEQEKSTVVAHSSNYAPPEQQVSHTRKPFTPASDIYALGATLYHCLTGRLPDDPVERLVEEMPTTRELNSEVPQQISDAIAKAMALKKEDRYQHVSDFWRDMTEEKKQEDIPAPPPMPEVETKTSYMPDVPLDKPKPRKRRLPVRLISIIVLIFIAVIGGIWLLKQGKSSGIPLQEKFNAFIQSGNSYIEQNSFKLAHQEYEKAFLLNYDTVQAGKALRSCDSLHFFYNFAEVDNLIRAAQKDSLLREKDYAEARDLVADCRLLQAYNGIDSLNNKAKEYFNSAKDLIDADYLEYGKEQVTIGLIWNDQSEELQNILKEINKRTKQ